MSSSPAIESPDISIRSASGTYDVRFTHESGEVAAALFAIGERVVVVDARVAELHPWLVTACGNVPTLRFEATEGTKTLAGLGDIATFLQSADVSASGTIIVVGGGIVQDVAALAASMYKRGIGYALLPTTLLSMADSCIGAKFGVNHGRAKNQLGGFLSPRVVAIDERFLGTLSADEIRSGYGEIVKLAIIEGGDSFAALERSLAEHGFTASAEPFIRASLATKKRYIEEDEFDRGVRRILNYGHTFGHALEAIVEYTVPHGLAVAWGCDLANYVARRLGVLSAPDDDRMHELLRTQFATRCARPYSAPELVGLVRRDKKARAGVLTMVLPRAIGHVDLTSVPIDGGLEALVASYLTERDIFAVA